MHPDYTYLLRDGQWLLVCRVPDFGKLVSGPKMSDWRAESK